MHTLTRLRSKWLTVHNRLVLSRPGCCKMSVWLHNLKNVSMLKQHKSQIHRRFGPRSFSYHILPICPFPSPFFEMQIFFTRPNTQTSHFDERDSVMFDRAVHKSWSTTMTNVTKHRCCCCCFVVEYFFSRELQQLFFWPKKVPAVVEKKSQVCSFIDLFIFFIGREEVG